MKILTRLSALLLVASIVFACSSNKEQTDTSASNESASSDSVAASETVMTSEPEAGTFVGEYLIGDGSTYIVPVGDTFEMRDGTGKASDVFFFQGKESDTLSVYSNEEKTITFKMNPDHKQGKYYAGDEELPVELVGPVE